MAKALRGVTRLVVLSHSQILRVVGGSQTLDDKILPGQMVR